ncbi:hypothetical protein F383_38051 [Gossypium arboreum]|uniref:Uncharacterized protein n=1 Tax=Gossypium arboreum TaxID=29729 RepID=A0A0B0MA37_GOSAR|nr:hypothetical protein F383_38051 [Gossypium arboreum]
MGNQHGLDFCTRVSHTVVSIGLHHGMKQSYTGVSLSSPSIVLFGKGHF